MKFEHTLTSNWSNAFRGLRNPMNSWEKSDSYGGLYNLYGDEGLEAVESWMQKAYHELEPGSSEWMDTSNEFWNWFDQNAVIQFQEETGSDIGELFFIGPNDLSLAQRMIAAGTPNDKFLRQIFVSVDITAPLYVWKELDTYKVGTVTNSTSTMHKIASTPITIDCFETDDIADNLIIWPGDETFGQSNYTTQNLSNDIILHCEQLRKKYLETKDEKYWKELIRWLPESWLQIRTWTANYSILRNIYHWRKEHRLTEWHQFCDWIKTLPYAEDLILYKN